MRPQAWLHDLNRDDVTEDFQLDSVHSVHSVVTRRVTTEYTEYMQ